MDKATDGDTVTVNYTGKLEDGSIFDSSADREPLEFTIGKGELISGFEDAVLGLHEGDSTTVNIPTDEAYGERQDDLEIEIAKTELPEDVEPDEGMQLQMKRKESDNTIPVRITNIADEKVTLDANHPLAGKDLIFDIEVVEIEK